MSSFRVDPDAVRAGEIGLEAATDLASWGYLLDVGGSRGIDQKALGEALDNLMNCSPHTSERTGYADDPLTLAGLTLLARAVHRPDASNRLTTVAQARAGAMSITHAIPFAAATGTKPRLTAVDESSISQIAAVVLSTYVLDSLGADLLPATTIDVAPERLVQEAALNRLPHTSTFDDFIVLVALEVMLGTSGQVGPTDPSSPPRDAHATDLVFIVALREEFRVLFEEIGHTDAVEVEGCTYYTFFSHGYRCQARLVGEMGTEAALMATERAIAHWSPRAVVFLGIAGGIHADVKIGDIVVASQIDLYMCGTKAMDVGDGFDLQHSGHAFQTSHMALQRVRNVEFSHAKIFRAWQQACRVTTKIGDSESGTTIRERPALFDGHIASGPTVGASGRFLEWLKRRDRKYLALEMEGGGAAMSSYSRPTPVPVLVIRGISDHADANKAELDRFGDGALRLYAMHNVTCFALNVLLPAGVFGAPA